MFAVIYQFNVKENRESEFIGAWKQLTQLIYDYEGSLGSRLHKLNDIKLYRLCSVARQRHMEKLGKQPTGFC